MNSRGSHAVVRCTMKDSFFMSPSSREFGRAVFGKATIHATALLCGLCSRKRKKTKVSPNQFPRAGVKVAEHDCSPNLAAMTAVKNYQ
jgi:hypothetical protein